MTFEARDLRPSAPASAATRELTRLAGVRGSPLKFVHAEHGFNRVATFVAAMQQGVAAVQNLSFS